MIEQQLRSEGCPRTASASFTKGKWLRFGVDTKILDTPGFGPKWEECHVPSTQSLALNITSMESPDCIVIAVSGRFSTATNATLHFLKSIDPFQVDLPTRAVFVITKLHMMNRGHAIIESDAFTKGFMMDLLSNFAIESNIPEVKDMPVFFIDSAYVSNDKSEDFFKSQTNALQKHIIMRREVRANKNQAAKVQSNEPFKVTTYAMLAMITFCSATLTCVLICKSNNPTICGWAGKLYVWASNE